MADLLFFEDVREGDEVPSFTRTPSTQHLVMFGAATGDYYPIHFDKDFAQRSGLSGVIVQGRLKASFLMQMLRDWAGEQGRVKQIGVQHRGMDLPSNPITCSGIVTRKYVLGAEHCVECDIWVENGQGDRTVKGTATVVLPSRMKA